MPVEGLLPHWLLPSMAAAAIFAVMLDLGLAIVPGESRWVAERPALLAKALFSALVAVPALAWIAMRILDLPRQVEIGIMLMAIAPGAPVALRRSIGAGGHRAFAPALQIALTTLAVVSMPLTIAALDEYYGGNASIEPRHLARQVLVAQLVPLALGMLLRRFGANAAQWLAPRLHRVAGVLLGILVLLALVDFWPVVSSAGPMVSVAIAVVTLLALGVGQLLGGPDPATRTATAISSALRNPGLALLVAALNDAPPRVTATIVTYLVVAGLIVLAYVKWRTRAGAKAPAS